jgi:CHASE2 domain-containing sensor protein
MNTIKKLLGLLWMLLAPAVVGFLAWQAVDKIGKAAEAAKANVTLQWVIILVVFMPICAGLFIFGYYSFKGYYAHLPQSSAELVDY